MENSIVIRKKIIDLDCIRLDIIVVLFKKIFWKFIVI